MLMIVALLLAGFVVGVALTGTVALFYAALFTRRLFALSTRISPGFLCRPAYRSPRWRKPLMIDAFFCPWIRVMKRKISHPIMSRLFRWAGALAGAGLAGPSPVHAQAVDPASAPVEWVRYAQSATASVTQLLEGPTEAATRLRSYLDQTRPAPDQPTAPLVLKV